MHKGAQRNKQTHTNIQESSSSPRMYGLVFILPWEVKGGIRLAAAGNFGLP